jgi:hypothetical protein
MSAARFWTNWLLIVVGVVALSLWAWPTKPAPGVVSVRARDDWTASELPRWRIPLSVPVTVAGAGYWGNAAAPIASQAVEGPPQDNRWRLAGVVGTDSDRRVLVSPADGTKPVQWLKVGELLPSGHRITRITDTHVCVRVGTRTLTLALERAELPR